MSVLLSIFTNESLDMSALETEMAIKAEMVCGTLFPDLISDML
jgi:hypothetical protein